MVKIKFLGHACFLISDDRYSLIVDPWLTGNPLAAADADDIDVDAVLVSHGHYDHLGDGIAIAKRCNAPILAPAELATYCKMKGAPVHAMHLGGSHRFLFGKVKLTPAMHGSSVTENGNIIYTGNPCGFIIELGDKVIYHAGDTGLFGDMKLIGDRYEIDAALLPIGDNFVMGIDDAAVAVDMLLPKVVIPMHYNTFELIKQDPEKFAEKVKGIAECVILQPGEEFSL